MIDDQTFAVLFVLLHIVILCIVALGIYLLKRPRPPK